MDDSVLFLFLTLIKALLCSLTSKSLIQYYRQYSYISILFFFLLKYVVKAFIRSASERRLVVPSQRGSKSLSRTFSFTVPGWWNELPTPIRNAGSLSNFKQQLKTHLFQLYLTTYKKNIYIYIQYIYKTNYFTFFQNLHLSLYLSLIPLLACTYLNNAWDLVLLPLPLYVCLFKINCFMYFPIVSRFG